MKGRRSLIKLETPESKALKRMRLSTGLSLREISKKTGLNVNMINHAENGRSTITSSYIQRYAIALGYTMDDWQSFLNDNITVFEMRTLGIEKIKSMNSDEIKAFYLLFCSNNAFNSSTVNLTTL